MAIRPYGFEQGLPKAFLLGKPLLAYDRVIIFFEFDHSNQPSHKHAWTLALLELKSSILFKI